jgi:hypothetical protein
MLPVAVLRRTAYRRSIMTLCPIAIVAGCRKCPVVGICPLKGIIGDYKAEPEPPPPPAPPAAKKPVRRAKRSK